MKAPRIKTPTKDGCQELATSLVEQLKMTDQVVQQCNVANGYPRRNSLHGVVLVHGVGRYGSRLPRGMRKLTYKLCFSHATTLLLSDADRFVYCEGYAVRRELGFVVGEHAWVLDRERDWAVIDNTWKDPATAVYLGIPFSYEFISKCLTSGNRVYGALDRYDLRYPILTEPPEAWLHADAALIPRDFDTPNDQNHYHQSE